MSINYVRLVCDLFDGTGQPLSTGTLTFIPNATLTDSADHITITQAPVIVNMLGNPMPVVELAATDNTSLAPTGWAWLLAGYFPGAPPRELFLLPFSAGATQYLSEIIPAVLGGYLPETGGTVTGAVTFTGTPALAIPAGAAAGDVLTSDSSGNASWQAVVGGEAGTVTIAEGGTGQVTQVAAFNALSPVQALGDTLYGSASNVTSRLPGNITTGREFLSQTGTGSVSASPAWGLLTPGDVPGVAGVTVSGSPAAGKILTATSASSADWEVPASTGTGGGTGGGSTVTTVTSSWPFLGDAVQRLAIPSYFYPTYYSGTGYWQQMQAAAPYAAICVINPNSGPGSTINTDYVTQAQQAQAAGMKVLGYVHTSYGSVAATSIQAQVDDYYGWYSVDGIFIDECATSTGEQPYYLGLYEYVKGKTASATVVINPGTDPDESYMGACDILCACETDLGTYRTRETPSWEAAYPASRFWHIIYAVLTTAQRDEVLTLSRGYRAGFVHITSDTDPNPYDTLPADPYWSGMVTQIAAPYPVPSQAPVLEDGFDATTGTISSQWDSFGAVTITAGQLVITGHSTFADSLVSSSTFAFAGHAATVEAAAVPAAASGEALMSIGEPSGDQLAIGTAGSSLLMRSTVSGTNSDTTITYSGTAHLWWRIALSAGGTATWQTSPDNAAWTVQRTVSSGLPVLTTARLELIAGHTSGSDPDQNAVFDNALVL